MASFQDTKGETWIVHMNLGHAKEIKQRFDIDVFDPTKVVKLSYDMFLLGEIIAFLCHDEIERRKITDISDRMNGDTLDAAFDAFIEASFDLLPPRSRPVAKQDWQRGKEAQKKSVELATRIMERKQGEITEKMEMEIESKIEQLLRNRLAN